MAYLLHHLIAQQAARQPQAVAVRHPAGQTTYATLAASVESIALHWVELGLAPGERVAFWLPKRIEAVQTVFATSAAGGVVVPINPLLKPAQAAHVLRDSGARLLVTQTSRWASLQPHLAALPALRWVALVDDFAASEHAGIECLPFARLIQPMQGCLEKSSRASAEQEAPQRTPETYPLDRRGVSEEATQLSARGVGFSRCPQGVETDLAALLYTSGSTGHPKGVMLTQRNLLAGAESVAKYLGIQADDRLLAVLPLSFDYGLSQLTTAFARGASVTLLDYLLPRDLHKIIVEHEISVLAGVPTLWHLLAAQPWLPELCSLRVLTNSGGHFSRAIVNQLRLALPQARLFLMYGLTEAFRSTYLPPEMIDQKPDSIGKAIPNARIHVLRADGTPCAAHEPGELVHQGPTVARGYWQDAERTAERFRPLGTHGDMAVWSGDQVRMDEDGYLYFIARQDDMIKSSGFRISPSEIEEALYASGLVREAVALGVRDEALGQHIVVVVSSMHTPLDLVSLQHHLRETLPSYMQPQAIHVLPHLPHTPNGKLDRAALKARYASCDE